MKLSVELVKILLTKSVECDSNDKFNSVQLPTIFMIMIFDRFDKS